MTKLIALATLLSACTPEWRQRVETLDSHLMTCDTASTLAASDGGRWDRGQLEENPLLGQRPQPPVLILGWLIAQASLVAAERLPDLPEWLRYAYVYDFAVVESLAVANNWREGTGFCGAR